MNTNSTKVILMQKRRRNNGSKIEFNLRCEQCGFKSKFQNISYPVICDFCNGSNSSEKKLVRHNNFVSLPPLAPKTSCKKTQSEKIKSIVIQPTTISEISTARNSSLNSDSLRKPGQSICSYMNDIFHKNEKKNDQIEKVENHKIFKVLD